MTDIDQWLTDQIERVRERFEAAETDSQAYQFAAEAETYARIQNGTLLFGSPEDTLEVYEEQVGQGPDFGMTAARIRAIKRYIEASVDR